MTASGIIKWGDPPSKLGARNEADKTLSGTTVFMSMYEKEGDNMIIDTAEVDNVTIVYEYGRCEDIATVYIISEKIMMECVPDFMYSQ